MRAIAEITVSIAPNTTIDVVYKSGLSNKHPTGSTILWIGGRTVTKFVQSRCSFYDMLPFLAILACIVYGGHGLGTHRNRSPKFNVLYEPDKLAERPQSKCYTYMTTVLITLPANPTASCQNDPPYSLPSVDDAGDPGDPGDPEDPADSPDSGKPGYPTVSRLRLDPRRIRFTLLITNSK
ncbi:hypothetical protein ANO14919_031190 [Xylariales sp. No.14919]|nr:hypothetical protein ANO14919_031190 [Xylariales sp. No.14919]